MTDYEKRILENRYEYKRREYEKYKTKTLSFMNKTYDLLKLLGLTDKEILEYYERGYKCRQTITKNTIG